MTADAQTLEPGLWEIATKVQGDSGRTEKAQAEMQKQLAAMPPERRKKLENMMAEQGVAMGAGGAAGTGIRMCMTQEMAKRNEVPGQNRRNCKTSNSPRSGNSMKISFSCTNPPSNGEGEITFVSRKAYTLSMAVSAVVQGKPEKMNLETSGKWLSADCGGVKPMPVLEKAAPEEAKAPARPSGTNDDVLRAVRSWASAWASKDVPAYLSSYAKDFKTPGGEARSEWENQRRQRILAPKKIEVLIESPKVTLAGTTAPPSLSGRYTAPTI